MISVHPAGKKWLDFDPSAVILQNSGIRPSAGGRLRTAVFPALSINVPIAAVFPLKTRKRHLQFPV